MSAFTVTLSEADICTLLDASLVQRNTLQNWGGMRNCTPAQIAEFNQVASDIQQAREALILQVQS